MTYATVDVIVDGALEDTETFTDYLLMNEFIDGVRVDAESDGYETEVFIQYHEHDMDIDDCACAQYETDHSPAFVFNAQS